jgi:serine/threonine protein kinase
MSDLKGETVDRYHVLDKIGAGGMGEVWRALDTVLDREVAIKVLPEAVAADQDRLARFEREAKAVAALSHPNILAIHDFGSDGETAFAVTELLEGETLREAIRAGNLTQSKACEYTSQNPRLRTRKADRNQGWGGRGTRIDNQGPFDRAGHRHGHHRLHGP